MKLPSRAEAEKLLKKHITSSYAHIIEHSKKVNCVAVYLAKRLKEAGVDVDVNIVDIASLLHDLDKVYEIEKGFTHGEYAMKLLSDMGYPELGRIVYLHRIDKVDELKSIEEKLVSYADARVLGSEIVSLRERFNAIEKRYAKKYNRDSTFYEKLYKKYVKLEEEIFSHLKEKPDKVLQSSPC